MALRIFFVEDSPTIRHRLAETLQEVAAVEIAGHAETEHQGRRWLAEHPGGWDVAIVDLFLREGSGLNVLEACAARAEGQKVVVLSNHSSRDVRWRCAQLGADEVFDKSTELEALLAWIAGQRGSGDVPAVTHSDVPLPAAHTSQQTAVSLHA